MPSIPEVEVPDEDPRFEQVRAIVSRGVIGASDRMPVRVIVLFLVLSICMTLAPTPANIIGIGATLMLAIDTSLHRR